MVLLTKSKYLTGLQCPKYLWIEIHEPEKIPPLEEFQLYRFDEGTLIGETAKKLFQKGIDLANLEFKENIEKTKEALKKKKPIFEAGIMFGNCFSRADILVPVGNKWDIIEVKASTKVKDVYLDDVSFQKYCYEGFGLKIRKCFLMHINKEYVRKGEIEPKKLFLKEDITAEVNQLVKEVSVRVDNMFKVIMAGKCPNIDIGEHCSNPYDCPIQECWSFLPEANVFDLYRIRKKLCFELVELGIHAIKDVPDHVELTAHQEIQKNCELKGKPYVNKDAIKRFLDSFEYPLYYLDFESFNSGIPMFDGLKSYQQVPFQFSLHVVKSEKSKPKHYSFLASSSKDPRKDVVSELKRLLGDKGSIIVYNRSFEVSVLKGLAELFPKYKPWVEKIVSRIVDLIIPFRNFYYYHPKQKGSASLKYVLPAVTGKGYDGLDIADGGTASMAFLKMTFGDVSEAEKKKVRKNLEKYCKLDTEGMVWIVNRLRGSIIINRKKGIKPYIKRI